MADLGKQLEIQLALNKALEEREKILQNTNNLLQNQLGIEQQLKKGLEDRSQASKDIAANMREASEESENSHSGAKKQNKTMEQQLKLADQLRNKTKEKNKESTKENQQAKKQQATWKDLKKAAGEYFKTILSKYPKTVGAFIGMARAAKDVKNMLSGIGGILSSVVGGAFKLGKAILAMPFKMIQGIAKMQRKMAEEAQPLRDAIEGVRKAFGGLNSEMGSKVMAATKKFSMGAKSAAFGGRSLMSVFGYGSAGKAKFMEAITKTMAGLNKLAPTIARTFSEKKMREVMGFQKAFELSDEALAGFVKTAEITGGDSVKALKRAAQAAKNLSKGTGVTAKAVMQGMGEMKSDFVSFGHMSTEQMAAAVVSVKQFGGSVKDLKAVQDKFMNFEGAAESLSTLNQAFGMQIDAMDMLKAKNPAEQIDKMRQAFFATGRSIEDLNMHEKKMLQQQTGLSDAMMQSAFSANKQGKSMDQLNKEAEKNKKKKLDQTKVLKQLADALEKFTGLGQEIGGVGDGLSKGFMRAISMHPEMRKLMQTTRLFLLEVRQMGFDLGNVFMDLMSDSGILGSFNDMLSSGAFTVFRKDIIGAMKELANFLKTGEGNPDSIVNMILGAFEKLGDAKGGAGNRMMAAFERLGDVIGKLMLFLWNKFIFPGLKTIGGLLVDWFSENWMSIAQALWPVIAVMLGWVMLKAAVGAAAGAAVKKAISYLYGAFTKSGPAEELAENMTESISDALDSPGAKGKLKKAGQFISRNIGGFAKIAAVAAIGYGIIKGVGGAFDEYEKSGSLRNAGNQYIASFVSGITFGLVSETGVREAMDRMLGRDFTDPAEEAMFHLSVSSSKAARDINEHTKGIAQSSKFWKEYSNNLKNTAINAEKAGKILSKEEKQFNNTLKRRAQAMVEFRDRQGKLDKAARDAATRLEKNTARTERSARFNRGGRRGRGGRGNMFLSGEQVKGMKLAHERGGSENFLQRVLKEYEGSEESKQEIIQRFMDAGDPGHNTKNVVIPSAYTKAFSDAVIKARKDMLTEIKANTEETAGTGMSGMETFYDSYIGRGVRDAAELEKIIAAEDPQKKVINMIQHLESVRSQSSEQLKTFADTLTAVGVGKNLTMNEAIAKLKEAADDGNKEAAKQLGILSDQNTAMLFGQVKGLEGRIKDSRMKVLETAGGLALIDREMKLFADAQRKNFTGKDGTFDQAGFDKLMASQRADVRNSFIEGSTANFTYAADEARKFLEDKNLVGGLPKAAARESELAKLEAAQRTIERIEKLKDAPARLEKLRATLAGWDKKKTAQVAKDLMGSIKIIVDAINDGVKESGLDKTTTVLSDKLTTDIDNLGRLVKGVNEAFDVKAISQEQATVVGAGVKAVLDEMSARKPELETFNSMQAILFSGVESVVGLSKFIGNSKAKSGMIGIFGEINASSKLISRVSSKIPTLAKMIGSDTSEGMVGIAYNANALFNEMANIPNVSVGDMGPMFDDMSMLAKGTDKFASSVEKFSVAKFSKAGTVAKVVAGLVKSYNHVQQNLQSISDSPIDLSVKLTNFANAMQVNDDTFKIKNEALNFTVNVQVHLDVDDLSDRLADPHLANKVGPVIRDESNVPTG